MIFQELILRNFGPYQGRQTIDLTPSSEQPIILCGGLNGGGKTTLMDAIRLALYGQRAQCSTRGNLPYHEFLNQCINRHSNGPSTRLELSFQHTLNNAPQPTEFRVRRTWKRLGKNGRDTLTVLQNGLVDDALTQAWDEHIETLFPLGISNLFLFDGEQVKELAEDLTFPPSVVRAIRSLLGLELPDRLAADLDVLATRKQKKLASPEQRQKLLEIEQTLETQIEARQLAYNGLAALRPRRERAEETLRLAEEKFIVEGGRIAAEKAGSEQQLKAARAESDRQAAALRDLAATELPLALILPLLHQARTQAQRELAQQKQQVAQDVVAERDRALLDFLQQEQFPPNQIEKIQHFLQRSQPHQPPAPDLRFGITPAVLYRLSDVCDRLIPQRQRAAQQHQQALATTTLEIENRERYLATAAAPEAYEQLTAEVRTAQAEAIRLQAEFEQADRHHERAKQALERTKKELATYSQLAIEVKNAEHTLHAIAEVQQILKIYQRQLKLQKLNRLETLVTECFLYLLHKSDLVHRIQIDTETLGLLLYDHEGEPVPQHRLSAGEKQLLAIALLWGLARASGRQLPIAIDTPLGRLDSAHRHNLIERYFPHASHQAILLSTDTEIRQPERQRLHELGAIAREYLLAYDPDQRQTTVQPGYFWPRADASELSSS